MKHVAISGPAFKRTRPSRDPLVDDADAINKAAAKRIRLAKQHKQLRMLASLRRVTVADLGVNLERLHDGLELGLELGLTLAEYQQLKKQLGCFPDFKPAGLTKDQAKAIRDDFNRPAKAAARAKRRAAIAADKAHCLATVADPDCRVRAVHTMLDINRWKTALQLSKLLKHSPAFQPLAGRSLKMAVQRALGKLVNSGRAKVKRERSKNGRPMDLFQLPLSL
jgi:hypothetical protein